MFKAAYEVLGSHPIASCTQISRPNRLRDTIVTVRCQFDYTRSDHEIAVAGAIKPSGLVVATSDLGQHRKYRVLVPAVSPVPPAAESRHGQHFRQPGHAVALRSLCFWLRLQIVSAASGCPKNLLVRYLAIQRPYRSLRGDGGRDLLRSAVGHRPAPAGRDSGSRHHLVCRLGDRAPDFPGAVLLVVRGADDQLSGQCHRKFDMGRCLPRGWDWPLLVATGVWRSGALGLGGRDHWCCRLSGFSDYHRRTNV